jgi:hypothetical protein
MSRILPALLLVSALGSTLLPTAALAQSKVAEYAKQLRTSDDYRVRTQAALALGASGEDAAVSPLCDGLGDSNAAVRVAAAAALGKLAKPAGLPCLKTAQGKETAANVKAQIEKSIGALGSAGGSSGGSTSAPAAPPPPAPDAKYYVAIQVTNKTSRPAAEIDAIVRAAMQDKLLAKKGFAVAPKSETPAQGGQVVKSKKLKGFLLIASVEAPSYAGGDLTQTLRISMWTYPDKSLQGEFAPKLTQSQTSKGDTQSENLLMKMCAENAIESFQKVAGSL